MAQPGTHLSCCIYPIPWCRVHSKLFDFYSIVLHSLLQARHQRPIIPSLSGVDDVDKFRFERGAAYEEAVDVRLECYFRLQSASVIPQTTTLTYRVRRSWNQRRSLRTRFGSIRRPLARWPWQGRRERRVEFLGPAKPSTTAKYVESHNEPVHRWRPCRYQSPKRVRRQSRSYYDGRAEIGVSVIILLRGETGKSQTSTLQRPCQ